MSARTTCLTNSQRPPKPSVPSWPSLHHSAHNNETADPRVRPRALSTRHARTLPNSPTSRRTSRRAPPNSTLSPRSRPRSPTSRLPARARSPRSTNSKRARSRSSCRPLRLRIWEEEPPPPPPPRPTEANGPERPVAVHEALALPRPPRRHPKRARPSCGSRPNWRNSPRRPRTGGFRNGNGPQCATRSSKPRRSSAVGSETRSSRRWRRLRVRRRCRLRVTRQRRKRPVPGPSRAAAATRRRRAVASSVESKVTLAVAAEIVFVFVLESETAVLSSPRACRANVKRPAAARRIFLLFSFRSRSSAVNEGGCYTELQRGRGRELPKSSHGYDRA